MQSRKSKYTRHNIESLKNTNPLKKICKRAFASLRADWIETTKAIRFVTNSF
jgi:hypothetical protein